MSEKIVIDPDRAEANVYYHFVNARELDVYLVKVSFKDAGIYINSITVQPSAKDPSKPWVQAPRFKVRATWVWPLQMEKTSLIWPVIETLALKAVSVFQKTGGEINSTVNTDNAFVKRENEFM